MQSIGLDDVDRGAATAAQQMGDADQHEAAQRQRQQPPGMTDLTDRAETVAGDAVEDLLDAVGQKALQVGQPSGGDARGQREQDERQFAFAHAPSLADDQGFEGIDGGTSHRRRLALAAFESQGVCWGNRRNCAGGILRREGERLFRRHADAAIEADALGVEIGVARQF